MTCPRSLTLVTAPAAEPVSLAEAKGWARIDGAAEDALIEGLITAARAAAEEYLRRSLITQTWKLTLDLPPSGFYDSLPGGTYDLPVTALYAGLPESIALPRGPVRSVTSVTTYDTTNSSSAYASSNYYLDAAGDRLVLNDTAVWPGVLRPRAACEVLYTAGYGDNPTDVPKPIRTAILMHVGVMYETRGACEGQTDLPPACKQLMVPYRILGERRG